MTSRPIENQKMMEFNSLELFEDFLQFWNSLHNKLILFYQQGIIMTIEDDAKVDNIPRYIQRQLIDFAEQQKQQVNLIALPGQMAIYHDILYAVVAFIDEQLLQQVKWNQQQNWIPLMLELKLFGSRNSGEKLINRMQELSETSHELSDEQKALVKCYLRVLWLGFDGKFRNQSTKLQQLKKQLMINAELTTPDLSVKNLFSQAYLQTINPMEQSRLAPISKWQRYIVRGIFGYLFVTGIFWLTITWGLANRLSG